MRTPNKHTCQPQRNIWPFLCSYASWCGSFFYAYANYHIFCIGFERERPLENGTYLIYVYSCSLNEHALLSSEDGSSFKVYLHILPYFNLCLLIVVALLSLCRCAGSFKHFLGVHVQKAYCKFSTYFRAFSKGPGQLAAHCLFSFENVAHEQWAILWDISTYLMCIQYWLKPACASVQSCKSIYCLNTMYLSHMHIHVTIISMQTQLSSRLAAVLNFGE